MPQPSRRYTFLTNAQRQLIRRHHDQHPNLSYTALAKWFEEKHHAKIHPTTISRTLKRPDEFHAAPHRKRKRNPALPDVEEELVAWVDEQARKRCIDGTSVRIQARIIATRKGIPVTAHSFSKGWLYAFQKRYGIKSFQMWGESGTVDQATAEAARTNLRALTASYPPYLRYNADETGLFWRREPGRTLARRRPSGRKRRKERISVLFCSNQTGTHKLPLLIIGTSGQPRYALIRFQLLQKH